MKRKIKLLSLFLAVVIMATVILTQSSGAASLEENYNSLESQLKSIKSSQAALANSIASARADASSQAKVVSLLYDEIDSYQQELNTTSALIDEYTALVQTKESEIDALNEQMSKNFDLFKERLVLAQESGSMSYIDFILGSSDISDILTRSEVINDMLEYDRKIITSLSNDKAQIEAAKIEVENALALSQTKKAEYETTLASLQTKVSEANAYLAQIQSNVDAQKAALSKINASRSKMESEMDELAKEIAAKSQNKPFSGRFMWPLPATTRCYISQNFGPSHSGMDIAVYGNPSVPALASASGTVVRTGTYWDWGNLVVVDHGGGYMTYYAHLSSISVSNGQTVAQGQQVGIIGNTGQSFGIHLHIVFYVNGQRVNPANYIAKP